MQKRGQITVFVVIGIVILALFGGIYYFTSRSATQGLTDHQGELALSSQVQSPVTLYVEKCLRDVGTPGVYLASIQGGVIYSPEYLMGSSSSSSSSGVSSDSSAFSPLFVTENGFLSYGLLGGVQYLSVEMMQKQLERYLVEELPECLGDFSLFRAQGVEVVADGEMIPHVTIRGTDVLIAIDYDLIVRSGENEQSLNHFEQVLPLRMGLLFGEAEQLIESVEKNPSQGYVVSSSDYFLSTFPYDGSTFVYSLSDKNSVIDGAPLTFMFAVDMPAINTAPVLAQVSDLVVHRGGNVEYSLLVEDREENVVGFSSSNSAVSVDNDGAMNFVGGSVGDVSTLITVRDAKGLEDSQTITFHVIE